MYYLRAEFPKFYIPKKVLSNAIKSLRDNKIYCSLLVENLALKLESGEVEFFDFRVEDTSNTLISATWIHNGSNNVVRRCGYFLGLYP